MFTVKLLLVLNPTILLIVLAYSYANITRLTGHGMRRDIAMGLVMGLAALLAMLFPFTLAEGVIVDMRNLIVGLSAAFFGVFGAAVTLIIAGFTRYMIGGTGMLTGLTGILIAAGMGLFWLLYVKQQLQSNFAKRILLGMMISCHLLVVYWLPADIRTAFLTGFAPWFVVFNILGAYALTAILDREERMFTETQDLRSAAATDPLTQLMNRRSLLQRYDAMTHANQNNHGMAMLCFDIDHFKQINDTYGHSSGDQVLLAVKSRVAGCLRPEDLFSRLGGDEFVVVLANVTHAETRAVAERCRGAMSGNPVAILDQSIKVTISIGVEWTQRRHDFGSFLERADASLYSAKALGRDRVAFGSGQEKPDQRMHAPVQSHA